ncbi:MAG: RNA polymerase factor sigma-54 [Bacteroides sp.]|nr:RNA polymerase factor sigma-54 [Bacteroides sp.]
MRNSQELGLRIGQQQRLSQQQLRFVRMLEMNPEELRAAVETEVEANPALESEERSGESLPEIDRTDGGAEWGGPGSSWSGDRALMRGYRSGGDATEIPFAPEDRTGSLADFLLGQLGQFNASENVLAGVRYLIGSMDSNGYIYRPAENLRHDMEFHEGLVLTDSEMAEAWKIIRRLDPPGVGASSLQESLEIQLERLAPGRTRDLALRILKEEYDLFTKKHFDRIGSALGERKEDVARAVELIRSLNPKPGASVGSAADDVANVIVPDFIFDRDDDGNMSLTMNNRFPELRISRSFDEAVAMLKTPAEKKRNSYVLGNWREARDFIELLSQRQATMMRVMGAILKLQREYFETEDIYRLRPMIIKDVAAETGLDISVISRATANKHIETPWGTFPLRFFFSDTVGDENGADTEALTNRKIEAEIRTIVEGEDKRHPLSDEKIREAMLARGYDVSRRTVAKYRDRLGIAVARLRKN